jgi:hypothetical protein
LFSICDLYSITIISALFRVINRYVGNLPPMPGVFPDYPAPVVRNAGGERDGPDALGNATAATGGGPACHEYSQHLVPALAGLAQT